MYVHARFRLTKLETLKNALYPQEEKFPSKKTVYEGEIIPSEPKIGQNLLIIEGKGNWLRTSTIENIEKTDQGLILTTLDSKYLLEKL